MHPRIFSVWQRLPLLAFLMVLSVAQLAAADTLADGRPIAQRVHDRDDGRDSYAEVRMVLRNKGGKERSRMLVMAIKDFGELHKRFIRFTTPASIEGTAFLAWENADRSDDQFLYLPALRRVRRIVSSQRKNRFVNSDFTYEDMERRKVDADTHRTLRSETYQGYACWVLESVPTKDSNSQYGKLVRWVTKDSFVIVKTDFYDSRERLIKQYLVRDLQKISGIWTVMDSEMHDVKRQHRTFMKTLAMRYNSGLLDKIFTKRYMQQPQ